MILAVSFYLLAEVTWPALPRESLSWRATACRMLCFVGLMGAAQLPRFDVGILLWALAVAHAIELARRGIERIRLRATQPATAFFVLSAVHLTILLAAVEIGSSLSLPAAGSLGDRLLASPDAGGFFLSGVGLWVALRGGTVLIRSVLKQVGHEPQAAAPAANQPAGAQASADEYQVGRQIGNLERILIYFLAMNGHLEAVGFVLAAKSLARFKELDDRRFSEYYLLGTLTSTLVALGAAQVVQQVLSDLYPALIQGSAAGGSSP
ncbi:MAG: hypothetical protein AAGN46_01015 [Acidobacteriota bacterium]